MRRARSAGIGIAPYSTLDLARTPCRAVLASGRAVVVDDGGRDNPCPTLGTVALFASGSFISVPILAHDGELWGTLCGFDPLPRALTASPALASMTLFAALVAQQLKIQQELDATKNALLDATATAELREQFVAILGHDLRNPIGNIMTSAELMLQSLDNPERLRVLARLIHGSGRRMAGLVNDVLDLTRGKLGGGIALTLQNETDLPGAIALVVNELRGSYPGRDIDFTASEAGSVYCDAGRLAQLCSNLLKNALVYGDPALPVGVSVMIDDGGLELSVSNHGAQMSDDTLGHLFEPYWRAKTRSTHEGLGLGLFIVGEIARRHGGKVTVSSSPALTTFVFKLAARTAPAPDLALAVLEA